MTHPSQAQPPVATEKDINRWQAAIQERPEGPWIMGNGGSFDRTEIKPISDEMLAELAHWLHMGYTPWNGRSMPLSPRDRQFMYLLYFSVQGLVARMRAAEKAAAPSAPGAQPEPLCACKDRPASQCTEEWGPDCDLGNNEAHVRVYTPSQREAGRAIPRQPREEAAFREWLKTQADDLPKDDGAQTSCVLQLERGWMARAMWDAAVTAPSEAPKLKPEFKPGEKQCNPTLTQCPRCLNDIAKCDGYYGLRRKWEAEPDALSEHLHGAGQKEGGE
jgi:hypothetical protein